MAILKIKLPKAAVKISLDNCFSRPKIIFICVTNKYHGGKSICRTTKLECHDVYKCTNHGGLFIWISPVPLNSSSWPQAVWLKIDIYHFVQRRYPRSEASSSPPQWPSAFIQPPYGHGRDHVTKCIDMYISRMWSRSCMRIPMQSLDYLSYYYAFPPLFLLSN